MPKFELTDSVGLPDPEFGLTDRTAGKPLCAALAALAGDTEMAGKTIVTVDAATKNGRRSRFRRMHATSLSDTYLALMQGPDSPADAHLQPRRRDLDIVDRHCGQHPCT
jgi:hypothetical protein